MIYREAGAWPSEIKKAAEFSGLSGVRVCVRLTSGRLLRHQLLLPRRMRAFLGDALR
jgi:hypothetical protein